MSILDRVKAQGGRADGLIVEVPEWGEPGQPLVIHYHRPNLNHIAAATEAGHAKSPVRLNVDIFCQIARDEAGKPLFSRMDALALMETADPLVLGRLLREMGIVAAGDELDIEKN